MKKLAVIIALIFCLSAGALAESGAVVGECAYFAVGEKGGAALIMIKPGEGGARATVADRAEALDSVLAVGDKLYYLRKYEGLWYLACRGADGVTNVKYRFPEGGAPRALSESGGYLYVLLDDTLHVLYPETGNCFKLAGVKMESYAVADNFTYFSSLYDKIEYTSPEGAAREAGCLYRLNNNTGERRLLVKAGVSDIRLAGGKLYFRNYADSYALQSDEAALLSGRLHTYDTATGETEACGEDYEWQFFPTSTGLMVRRADGLYANGEKIAEIGEKADVIQAGDAVYIIEYESFAVRAAHANGEIETVYDERQR